MSFEPSLLHLKVEYCCMSQADLRLLLQPEELQMQQKGKDALAGSAATAPSSPPPSPPPSFEAYLKAEALRVAHQTGLFKLCPNCGEGVELDEGQARLVCPTCKAEKCLQCGVDWHTGSTCEAYQEVSHNQGD